MIFNVIQTFYHVSLIDLWYSTFQKYSNLNTRCIFGSSGLVEIKRDPKYNYD